MRTYLHSFWGFFWIFAMLIKHFLIFDKDSLSNEKFAVFKWWFHLLMGGVGGKAIQTYLTRCEKPDNCCAILGSKNCCDDCSCDNWQQVFHINVEEFLPTLLCRITLIQPHWGFSSMKGLFKVMPKYLNWTLTLLSHPKWSAFKKIIIWAVQGGLCQCFCNHCSAP